jgi:uncharacterized protein
VLELRPNCECCDKNLPPESPEAVICTFECTFCRDCAQSKLGASVPIAVAISWPVLSGQFPS